MKKELIITVLLGLIGIVFLGFVLANAAGKKPIQKQTQPSGAPTAASQQTTMQTFTAEDVALHASVNDCYMIVNTNVYDLTSYLPDHPGDISMYCGTDGTIAFTTRNGKGPHDDKSVRQMETMIIGTLQ